MRHNHLSYSQVDQIGENLLELPSQKIAEFQKLNMTVYIFLNPFSLHPSVLRKSALVSIPLYFSPLLRNGVL